MTAQADARRADLSPLAARVHDELVRIRGTRDGWTKATAALYPTLCAVLGGGDPAVSFSALRIAVLQLIDSEDVVAAAASLGLTTDSPTHTQRLDEAGADLGLDGRQVRRLSDRGLLTIARFIATNWNQSAVPRLRLTLIRSGAQTCDAMCSAEALTDVEMREPTIDVNGERQDLVFMTQSRRHLRLRRLERPLTTTGPQVHLRVQWRGELWPQLELQTVGVFPEISSNSLGNAMHVAVRLIDNPPDARSIGPES